MAAQSSPPASAFFKVLRSFETGGFTCRDVVAELKRLLKAGASPTELSEIVRRRQFVEPLPVEAHQEVVGLLDAAKKRAAAEAVDPQIATAGANSVPGSKPIDPPEETSALHPAPHPATARIPTPAPSAARAERAPTTTIRIVPPPRTADPISTTESKLITVPVQVPAARASRTRVPAQGSPAEAIVPERTSAAEGHDNMVARAITLARTSASPARASASPDSLRRKTGGAAVAKVTNVAAATVNPAPASNATPAQRVAPAPRLTPVPTLFPPVEVPVADDQPAEAESLARDKESLERDDWSDLAIVREDLAPDPITVRNALDAHRASARRSMMRLIGMTAAFLVLAVIAWFYSRHAPPRAAGAASSTATPNPGALVRDCPTCLAMIVLPAGGFKQGVAGTDRGSPSTEKPQHWVNIGRPFAMSADLVTVEDYRQFIDATGRPTRGCETYDGSWKYRLENDWRNPGFAQSGLHPVTCVSWNDAAAYAQWLSSKTGHPYRLPSASEWEYAARAGGEAVYPWSANGSNACAFANVADASAARRYPGWTAFACDDGYPNTSPVGSFKANPFGLNDMLGNVFQWTSDCWQADYRGAPTDGSAQAGGDCSERELRGGSWFTSPSNVRANYRNHFAADYRTSSVGIRLVRDVGP